MTAPTARRTRVEALLAEAGTTYAEEAGIRLADTPAPLWQLLVLANVVSTRIKASIAVHAARELFAAGGRTPAGMAELTWQQRVDALGRAHYVRYDEGTSTRLGACAELVRERYGGDLRRLAREAGEQQARVEELLCEFPGIGPAGARIFCREAQAVWPFLRPVLDEKALEGARRVGLPGSAKALAALVDDDRLAVLAAALVRVALDKALADRVAEATP
ncbi:endonuclease [Yinghuangia seranimata]|uniref:endonuclease n=1 Tax=Yinghuangia seranimata TaxID=408067 RepID=UPI00248C9559|nr:endonuclease [Yinghuangia seranimata]MDI2124680.1 endonuclease [Yinghuangia seranimata]